MFIFQAILQISKQVLIKIAKNSIFTASGANDLIGAYKLGKSAVQLLKNPKKYVSIKTKNTKELILKTKGNLKSKNYDYFKKKSKTFLKNISKNYIKEQTKSVDFVLRIIKAREKMLTQREKEIERELKKILKEERAIRKQEELRLKEERKRIREEKRAAKRFWKLFKEQQRIQKKHDRAVAQEQAKILKQYQQMEKRFHYIKKQFFQKILDEENGSVVQKTVGWINQEVENYEDWKNTLSKKEQKQLNKFTSNKDIKDMYSKEGRMEAQNLQHFYNSSWIQWATWIPHSYIREHGLEMYEEISRWNTEISSQNRGILRLKIRDKFHSKRNATNIYIWFNVSYKSWLSIIKDKTGKNFWKVFYKKNRKSLFVITSQSKYYDNALTKLAKRKQISLTRHINKQFRNRK